MKNIFVAAFLVISGFAISSLAIAAPVNAQTAIMVRSIKILRRLVKFVMKMLQSIAIKLFLR